MTYYSIAVRVLLLAILMPSPTSVHADDKLPVCMYISSYNTGLAWADGIEQGLRESLDSYCNIVQFNMDTKQRKSNDEIAAAAKSAYQLIVKTEPAVIITADDQAAKHLVVPYLKDSKYPVIFSGVNWTVKEYGFPFSNVTGIVEVAPIAPMLQQGIDMANGKKRAIYLGADSLSDRKNFRRLSTGAEKLGISLEYRVASSFSDWKDAFDQAQQFDFIIMGNSCGIDDWDHDKAKRFVLDNAVKPSLTNHHSMMPYTLLGYTNFAEEQGDWAGQSAKAILDGVSVSDIPLATNRKWDLWVNQAVLDLADIAIEPTILHKAKRISDDSH